MKVNGGYFRQDWFSVRFYNRNLLIGMLQIWRFKIGRCTVMTLSSSGSRDNVEDILHWGGSFLVFYAFFFFQKRKIYIIFIWEQKEMVDTAVEIENRRERKHSFMYFLWTICSQDTYFLFLYCVSNVWCNVNIRGLIPIHIKDCMLTILI